MKFYFLTVVAFFNATALLASNGEVTLPSQSKTIAFTENKGQVHDQNYKARPDVLFSGTDGKLVFHLKNNGISYQLNRVDSWKEEEDHKTKEKRKVVDKSTIYRVDINWLNANTQAAVKTGNALEGYNNYYLESCPNGALNVKSYEQVEYENIYKGINLKWYEREGQLKYDYIVTPHANYKQIQLQIKGAQLQLQKNGSLLLKTPLGTIEEHAPIVYQNGKKLKANYVLKGNVLSFNVENYDPNQQLIIDPLVRLWGTYYGGSGSDSGVSSVVDQSGNVFISGETTSNNGTTIATLGSHQIALGGITDAFLAKFNSLGVRQWGTYYGGGGQDNATSSCIDPNGDIYICGTTFGSNTVIASPGSHQVTYGGAICDAFLVKFNSSGVRLWSTYYGGNGADYGNSCCADVSGNVYLTGETESATGTAIATAGSHQSTSGSFIDAFLVKFNSLGVRQWGTYYGGSNTDTGRSCTTDQSGNVYLVGYTFTNDGSGLTTPGCHQAVFGGSAYDSFIAKFNTSGVRQWGTYYGGNNNDYAQFCKTDINGDLYVSGNTNSNSGNAIATSGGHQPIFGGGGDDAFLVKFNTSGVRQWGTYYGGSGSEGAFSISTNTTGDVFITGGTTSGTSTIIATPANYQPTFGGGNDAYLVKFNSLGARQWGTYYGGSGNESSNSCFSSINGDIFLLGSCSANYAGDVIITFNPIPHQASLGGMNDAFLVKFKDCPTLGVTINANTPLCQNSTLNFTATVTSTLTLNYNWQGPNSYTANIQNPSIANAGTVNAGTYTLAVNDGQGCSETSTVSVTVNLKPIVSVNSGSICSGNSFTINPSGANTYTIQGGNAVVSPNTTNSYTVVGTGTNGCVSDIATSNVTVFATPTIAVNSGAICSGNSFTINPGGANTYTIQGGNAVVSPTINTTYTVAGTSTAGCVSASSATSNVTVNANPTITAISNQTLCLGNNFTLTPSGATSYTVTQGVSLPASFISSIVITPTAGLSIYTVTGTNSFSCSGSNTLSTLVNPNPNVTAATSATNFICVGQSATLTASGALTYTFNPGGNGSSIVVSPSVTTNYTVTGTDANGCSNTAVITQSVDACAGLNKKESHLKSFSIYPNPSTGKFILHVPENGSITVYNSAGLLIYNNNTASGNSILNLELYPNGVYFIQFNSSNYFYSQKIIKQ